MESVDGTVKNGFGSDPKPETGMVEREIDAARALACLAVNEPYPREKEVRDEGGEEAKAVEHEGEEKEKAKEKTEEAKNGATTGHSSIGRRGKQNLTEAEREAKRLRRILANRESARQTILRRQAVREELAREVAALSSQNQQMKMEKDMATQEYLSLKETNRKLKEQIAWVYMSHTGVHYMWGPWTTRKCDPNTGGSGPFSVFSRNSPLSPRLQEMPSSSSAEHHEEKQFIPNRLEPDVSCSLTLGLETKNKLKMPAVELSHDKFIPATTCSKESEVKVTPSVKVAAEARRKRREIMKLKQMHHN